MKLLGPRIPTRAYIYISFIEENFKSAQKELTLPETTAILLVSL